MKQAASALPALAIALLLCACSTLASTAVPSATVCATTAAVSGLVSAWPDELHPVVPFFQYGTYQDYSGLISGDRSTIRIIFTAVTLEDAKTYAEEMKKNGLEVDTTGNKARYKAKGTYLENGKIAATILVDLEISSSNCEVRIDIFK